VRAFVPPPLPPDPLVDLSGLYQHLDRANQALGRLDGLTTLLPDTRLFLYLYVRKEARSPTMWRRCNMVSVASREVFPCRCA
jgi:Fic family protein